MVRRKKTTSCRPLKLTEAEQADFEAWLKLPHTLEQKAQQMGVSPRTLYRYKHGLHKPRKETVDIEKLADRLMSAWSDVSLGTIGERA